MYRENEAALAGAVMEASQARDRKQMMKAAIRLWLAPPEPTSDGALVRDVWRTLQADELEGTALQEVMRLVREKQRVRADAFVPIAYVATREQLIELAEALIAAESDAYPYLAVVFERLVADMIEAKPVEAMLRKLHPVSFKRTDLWTLGAFMLTTTNVGNRDDVDRWFSGWEQRPDVPMWIIAAYVGTLAQINQSRTLLVDIARLALAKLSRDGSAPFLERYVLVDDAVRDEHAQLGERLVAVNFDGFLARSPVTDPMVVYANGVRLEQPLDSVDFLYDFELKVSPTALAVGGLIGVAIANRNREPRPPHWRLVQLYQDMRTPVRAARRLLEIFVRMIPLQKGDPEVMEVAREWLRARPSEMSSLVPAWNRLLKDRVGWFARTFRL